MVPAQSDTSVTDIEHRAFVTAVRAQGRRLWDTPRPSARPPKSTDGSARQSRAAHSSDTLNKREDVLALVDHDASKLLGPHRLGHAATGGGHARACIRGGRAADDAGQRACWRWPSARDLGGMSFGFRMLADHWTDQRTRELRSVQLVEVQRGARVPGLSAAPACRRDRIKGKFPSIHPPRVAGWSRRCRSADPSPALDGVLHVPHAHARRVPSVDHRQQADARGDRCRA